VRPTGHKIIRNSLLRVGGYAIGAVLQFLGIVLIGRYLGAEQFGNFAVISAWVGIFQLVADMGVRNILIRNIAMQRDDFRQHLTVARTLLWFLSVLSMTGVVIVANLLTSSAEVRHAMYLAGLAALFTFYGLSYSAVLRAFEEMDWDICGFVLHKIVLIALLWLVSRTSSGLQGVFAATLVANAGLWLYFWAVVGIRHGRAPISLNLQAGRALLAEALPLGVAEILRRLKQHVDKLLLATLATPTAVGLFSAAYKLLEAMTPFTANVTLPLFPVFSRLAQESPAQLFRALGQSLKFLYIMGTPIAVLLYVFAEPIMMLFFGEAYRDATVTLQVLAPAVLLLMPTSAYSYAFTALGRQRLYAACIAISLLTNLILDLLLIPRYGYLGAAFGTLAAEASLFLAGLIMIGQQSGNIDSLRLLWRPLLAGLVMGAVCRLLHNAIPTGVVVELCSGLAAYGGLLLMLQTFTAEERALLTQALRIRWGTALR
jgi:O-antigen/teichoic acid export membrane protein